MRLLVAIVLLSFALSAARECRVPKRAGDVGAGAATTATSVEAQVSAKSDAPADAPESLGSRWWASHNLPWAERAAPIGDEAVRAMSKDAGAGLVDCNSSQCFAFGFVGICRHDLLGNVDQLNESVDVSGVGVEPEEQAGKHVHHVRVVAQVRRA